MFIVCILGVDFEKILKYWVFIVFFVDFGFYWIGFIYDWKFDDD